ncbi:MULTISPECIES: protein kinase domain-containing protein [unclassified Gordonia (in: high G+C Gram-positive bacteria)]|uniref:protein kinase domain-containing protein n=1 Tax=Gordonia TaxID=2053 RepID=UPI00071CAFAB|nr:MULTISPECIES: protein kinase [unclassified Gordonia (in: high G+C Gram-positive bacteria)]KSU56533.1 serine/threonine protein kinase [Gordonia sp. SGD-V-85]MBN0974758.1 serine/threonine protein kinase [Gordonia sp. BP-119]MBN0984794.1 serine/threonine protein kinase [Gordonia sp. BP-94]MDT0223528.1 protein kinase [Gordonia sp. AC31]SCC48555.1 serine/threonine protein kinase [Gordonia sp. v-85]
MSLQNGTTIGDRYRLIRLIATGGMGQVWEALDTRLNRRVAVKVLKAEYTSDPEFIARFRAEAQTTAKLNNPGIANVFDYGETPDYNGGDPLAYLVMELVDGEPLNSVISRLGRLSLTNTLDMLEQTGRALQAAHSQGLVHRDVKPGNILITPVGQVKITDFGIAKAVDSAPVTKTGMVMGTAQYISPEQATGDEATAASDVYSLGVVGYEALTGRRPFLGDGAITVAMKHIREAPPPLPTNLPSGVRELIEITMAKDPRQRYANGGEFADAVAAVRAGRRPPRPGAIAGAAAGAAGAAALGAAVARGATPTGAASRPVTPRPTSRTAVAPPPPDNSWTTGQKVLAGIAAALLVGAIGLIGFYLVNSGNGDAATPPPPSTTVVETTTAVEPTEEPDEPTTTRRTTRTTTSEETSSEETTTETTTPRQQTDTSEPPPDPGAATGTPCFPGVPFSPLC